MDKTASRKKKFKEFHRSLADTVVLLTELKAKPGITRAVKREIEDTVEKLQEVMNSLPEIAGSRDSFQLVFDVIEKAIGVWKKLFRRGG